jgi:hypothetical protein
MDIGKGIETTHMTHIWERAIGCNITKVKENAERQ